MEYLNTVNDDKDNKFVVFTVNSNYVCDCNFCANRETDSFYIMVLSDHLWGMKLNKENLINKFQRLNPIVDCNFVDTVKMIKSLISNYIKYEVSPTDDVLYLSFNAEQYDVSLQWNMELEKLISNEMFHHFVKPLVGALSKSHKIGTFLWDKWKSTRLYLDYVCLHNSIKVDVNKSFLNIPNDFSDLEEIVELSQTEIESTDDFSLIRGPFERQVKKNCEHLRVLKAKRSKSYKEPEQVVNHNANKDNSDGQQPKRVRRNLAEKLEKERNKPNKPNKKKKLI